MKTLYLSDLDGTFLNNNAKISDYSKSVINRLTQKGVLFTVATARTFATVLPIFDSVQLNCPLVLMNGVCIYDPIEKKTVVRHTFSEQTARRVIDIFADYGKYPMIYYEHNSRITVEYKKLTTKSQQDYVKQRLTFYRKNFVQTENYNIENCNDIVYAAILDKKQELEPIYQAIKTFGEVSCNFYPDNYKGEYFLEIFKQGVSKASGALEAKQLIGADKIVAFGDNLNDLPLFELADEAYAVENACDELKAAATCVIGPNTDDSVAHFLAKRYLID